MFARSISIRAPTMLRSARRRTQQCFKTFRSVNSLGHFIWKRCQ
jgi:hypothetical protein